MDDFFHFTTIYLGVEEFSVCVAHLDKNNSRRLHLKDPFNDGKCNHSSFKTLLEGVLSTREIPRLLCGIKSLNHIQRHEEFELAPEIIERL